ncbi:MAG: hypothetical protein O7E52_12160 [Candidatus Poribacteria bacterium]|nr:hypothetical protein [Candidatus Poribacteria bacterium]
MNCLDYGKSFICTVGDGNAPRFWVESRCRLIDDTDGSIADYYQCGSCKSEHTFAERNLFHEVNYDFLPVFGEEYSVVFRRHAYHNDNYAEYRETKSWWGGTLLEVQEANPVQILDSNEKILLATRKCLPIVTQTEIWDTNTQMRAIIECPVKTMNIDEARCIYQVDTGIVLFPDLSKRYDRQIEAFSLAYVAFNAPHFADFVLEQPTPIVADGKEVACVYHYSGIRSLEAKNTVLGIGEL